MSIVQTIEHERPEVYIGTKTDFEALGYFGTSESAWAILGLFDLPFSLVMDTIFLPYTISKTTSNNENQSNQKNAPDLKTVR
jgi:uncharacterized protein YceK